MQIKGLRERLFNLTPQKNFSQSPEV
jgi:predicted proteasome-type protease